jgi:hypothetical protein
MVRDVRARGAELVRFMGPCQASPVLTRAEDDALE